MRGVRPQGHAFANRAELRSQTRGKSLERFANVGMGESSVERSTGLNSNSNVPPNDPVRHTRPRVAAALLTVLPALASTNVPTQRRLTSRTARQHRYRALRQILKRFKQ